MYQTKKGASLKIARAIMLILMALMAIFALVGCTSLNKADAQIYLTETTFQYHEETNKTTVHCSATIENPTVYTIVSFDVKLGVYSDGVCMSDGDYQYVNRVKHGEIESISLSFSADGEIDHVGLISWTPQFEAIWMSYLTEIVIVGLVLLVGAYFLIRNLFDC